MIAPALGSLRAALDRAADEGRSVAFWWRDDDAVDVTPPLIRLCAIARSTGARVALAAIPDGATDALLAYCQSVGLTLWQHGAAHRNHETTGKAAELGHARSVGAIVAECVAVRARLASPAFSPVMVPPWNRMRADLLEPLARAGYHAVSMFGGSPAAEPLARLDAHIDPVDWRGDRSLVDAAALKEMVDRALAQAGPVGLLTHHLQHTSPVDAFVEAFAAIVHAHRAAFWVDPDETLRRLT